MSQRWPKNKVNTRQNENRRDFKICGYSRGSSGGGGRRAFKALEREKEMPGQWDGSVVKVFDSEAWQPEKPETEPETARSITREFRARQKQERLCFNKVRNPSAWEVEAGRLQTPGSLTGLRAVWFQAICKQQKGREPSRVAYIFNCSFWETFSFSTRSKGEQIKSTINKRKEIVKSRIDLGELTHIYLSTQEAY